MHHAFADGFLNRPLVPDATQVAYEHLIVVLQRDDFSFPLINLGTHNGLGPIKATKVTEPIRLQRRQSSHHCALFGADRT